jgi:hypothetical protein
MKTRLMSLFVMTLLLSACKKDDPVAEPNDEEVITTMRLTFVPQGGGATVTYQFDDPDGPGGAAPTQDLIILEPAKTYNVSIQLLNKTVTPNEDITTEVAGEAEAHRFYFETSAGSNIAVSGLDADSDGVSLGINSVWTTTVAGNGVTTITLRHYPGTPPNKMESDPVNSTKSTTDIEVDFGTRVL